VASFAVAAFAGRLDGWWVSSRDKSPAADLWHHNAPGSSTSFDPVVVRYGEDERVVALELLLD
jgi:hypothetical protein